MSIVKLTKLPPLKLEYRLDARLPIISQAADTNQQKLQARKIDIAAVHSHPRGRLLYACCGVLRVVCGRDIWVAPPSQAIWVPPDQEHEVYFSGNVTVLNLFVDPSAIKGLPRQCTVLKVTPLVQELILKAVRIGNKYTKKSTEWRLMQVLLDELRQAESVPLHLRIARDERVMRVIDRLLKDPGDNRDLEAWGRIAGASGRTLARLFVRETGLTFGAWRKRLLLQEAVNRLDRGNSVTTIALDLGYRSLSAFIDMFRRELGASPHRYARIHR